MAAQASASTPPTRRGVFGMRMPSATIPADPTADIEMRDDIPSEPLVQNVKAKLVKKLPDEMEWMEPNQGWLYPPEMEDSIHGEIFDLRAVHEDYRGRDAREFIFQRKGKQAKMGGRANIFGLWTMDSNLRFDNTKVRMRSRQKLDTQCPLYIIEFPDSNISCTIHAQSIVNTKEGFGLAIASPQDVLLQSLVPDGEKELKEMASSRKIWVTEYALEKGSRKKWINISDARLQTIRDMFEQDPSLLTESDRLMAALDASLNFRIYSPTDAYSAVIFDEFTQYFRTVSWLCRVYGYFWFYSWQYPETPISSPDWPWHATVPPRWMVQEWDITDKDRPVPHSWAAFATHMNFPDDGAAFLFLLKLGISRERQYQRRHIQEMLDSDSARILGSFTKDIRNPGIYIANLTVSNVDQIEEPIYPELDTRVEIYVKDGETVGTFQGQVIEDLLESGSNVCVAVSGPNVNFEDKPYEVTLKLIDDPTSLKRSLTALDHIQEGHPGRLEGIDLRALIIDAPTPGVDVEAPKRLLTDEEYNRAVRTIGRTSANEKQKRAIVDFLQSPTASALVQGPPGTGKTFVSMLLALVLVKLGEKVLVTAPPNEAVKTALDKFKSLIMLDDYLPASRYVLFKGAWSRLSRVEALENNEVTREDDTQLGPFTEEEALRNSIFDLVAEQSLPNKNSEQALNESYNRKLRDQISVWASTSNLKHHAKAIEYLTHKGLVQNKTWNSREERIRIKRRFRALEDEMHEAYLGLFVSVVFVTCSSSCHQVLREHFKPTVVLFEEAAIGNLADIVTPLAAHKNSIRRVWQSGDHAQSPPTVAGRGANEAYWELKISLFERLAIDTWERWPRIMLDQQYRMHSHISAFPSKEYYHGGLLDATTVNNQDLALQKTLVEYFDRLGAAWVSRRFRMGIDISGPDVKSEGYQGSASLFNQTEANFVVDLIRNWLEYQPRDPGARQITPGDIKVVTPYTGQLRAIRSALMKLPSGSGAHQVAQNIFTTKKVQGKEGHLVIYSHVRNVPGNPTDFGFTRDKKMLNVNLTRAKTFLMVLGNWRGWVDALQGNNPEMFNSGNAGMRNLVTDFLHIRSKDIVALSDWMKAFRDGSRPNNSAFYTARSTSTPAPSEGRGGMSGSFGDRVGPATGRLQQPRGGRGGRGGGRGRGGRGGGAAASAA